MVTKLTSKQGIGMSMTPVLVSFNSSLDPASMALARLMVARMSMAVPVAMWTCQIYAFVFILSGVDEKDLIDLKHSTYFFKTVT